jgi:hypothetical protein
MKEILIKVYDDYIEPIILKTTTPSQNQLIIDNGCKTYETNQLFIEKTYNDIITINEIDKLKKENDIIINDYKKKLSDYDNKILEIQNKEELKYNNKYEKQEEKYNLLFTKLENINDELRKEILLIKEKEKITYNEIIKKIEYEYELKIQDMKKINNQLNIDIFEIKNIENEKTNSLIKKLEQQYEIKEIANKNKIDILNKKIEDNDKNYKIKFIEKDNIIDKLKIEILENSKIEKNNSDNNLKIAREDYNKTIEYLKTTLNQVKELNDIQILKNNELSKKNDELQLKINERNNIINKSVLKGQQGEYDIKNIISDVFGNDNGYNLHGTTGNKKADIRFGWEKINLMVEVKNYSSDINTKEIDKFKRDMELNSEYNIGLMISLNTNIINHYRSGNDISYELINNGKVIIYMNNFMNNGKENAINTMIRLKPIIRILNDYIMRNNLLDNNYLEEIIDCFNKNIKEIINFTKMIKNMKKTIEDGMNILLNNIKNIEDNMTTSINNIKNEYLTNKNKNNDNNTSIQHDELKILNKNNDINDNNTSITDNKLNVSNIIYDNKSYYNINIDCIIKICNGYKIKELCLEFDIKLLKQSKEKTINKIIKKYIKNDKIIKHLTKINMVNDFTSLKTIKDLLFSYQ